MSSSSRPTPPDPHGLSAGRRTLTGARRLGADEWGATSIEYAILMMLIGVLLIGTVGPSGRLVGGTFCEVAVATGGSPGCTSSASPSPAASPTPTPTPGPSASAPAPTADPDASAGWMVLYTAVVDQDQVLSCLSIRANAGWQPYSWQNVTYPQVAVLDVTWTPALPVHDIIAGSSGRWVVDLAQPGHARLVRYGAFNASGWQPEPELLLDKPAATQVVAVSMTVQAANANSVSATPSTTSVPYQ